MILRRLVSDAGYRTRDSGTSVGSGPFSMRREILMEQLGAMEYF